MMNRKSCYRWAVGMVAVLGLQCMAIAGGVLLGGTRVIFTEKDREGSISFKNTGTAPYVVQAWSDAGEGRNKTPFVVTPPLSRLDPGRENILRILRAPAALPADRESVFWLNVKEIPEKSSEEDVLQVAVRTRIKLFYRPSGLPGKAAEAKDQLQWAVAADGKGSAVLRVANPTPYHVTLTTLHISGDQQQVIDADMVAPFGELAYPLTALKVPQEVQVAFSTVNDYGGETDRQRVRAPVAVKPVAVDAQAVEPAADAGGR